MGVREPVHIQVYPRVGHGSAYKARVPFSAAVWNRDHQRLQSRQAVRDVHRYASTTQRASHQARKYPVILQEVQGEYRLTAMQCVAVGLEFFQAVNHGIFKKNIL